MGYLLFAIFLGVPLIEIALFILVGGQIGALATIAVVVLTALAGAVLVRYQGMATLARARREIDQRRIPAGALGEGLALLLAAALLLTPGFFTDAIGFLLLVPPFRRFLVTVVAAWIAPKLMVVVRGRGQQGRGPIIDAEAIEIEEETRGKPDPRSPWRKS